MEMQKIDEWLDYMSIDLQIAIEQANKGIDNRKTLEEAKACIINLKACLSENTGITEH